MSVLGGIPGDLSFFSTCFQGSGILWMSLSMWLPICPHLETHFVSFEMLFVDVYCLIWISMPAHKAAKRTTCTEKVQVRTHEKHVGISFTWLKCRNLERWNTCIHLLCQERFQPLWCTSGCVFQCDFLHALAESVSCVFFSKSENIWKSHHNTETEHNRSGQCW